MSKPLKRQRYVGGWKSEITWILMPVARLWCSSVGSIFEDAGLTHSEAAPILTLARFGEGLHQKKVAEQIGVDGAALVRSIDKLESLGLIERRMTASDRRTRTLHLTDQGRKLATRLESILEKYLAKVFDGIDNTDGETTLRMLRRIEAESLRTVKRDNE